MGYGPRHSGVIGGGHSKGVALSDYLRGYLYLLAQRRGLAH